MLHCAQHKFCGKLPVRLRKLCAVSPCSVGFATNTGGAYAAEWKGMDHMNNFNLFTPTKVVFGKDTESQTGALVNAFGGQKVLLHYGSGSVVRSGLLDKIKASLQA